MSEALRLIEEIGISGPAILFTDCRGLVDLVARAEPRPQIPDSERIFAAFKQRSGLHLAYLHRRCRRMRLAHHLANARRLEAELAACRSGHHPQSQETRPC